MPVWPTSGANFGVDDKVFLNERRILNRSAHASYQIQFPADLKVQASRQILQQVLSHRIWEIY
jgi:hypothetical protein